MFFMAQTVFASEKSYYEAIINLQSIEKYFMGTPIYLSEDEELKSNLTTKLNRIIDIFEDFQKTNPKAPDDYRILFLLGKSYSFAHDLNISGAWHKSVDSFDQALKIHPGSEEVLLIQGKNYMDASKFAKAYELYTQAVESNPAGRGRLYMALAKISLGEADETKEILKQHLELYPNDQYAKQVLSAVEGGRAYGPN